MDGFLNLDKPAGMTSHDVVARVRRACQTKRAGHAGTLDPDAIGVLVVAVGQATRLLPYLTTEPKVYTARVVLGTATTTEDAAGVVTDEADASHLTEADLQNVIPRFVGEIPQTPPMVSAVHHEGRRLYELARAGKTVERQARPVTIFALSAEDFSPGTKAEATLRVSCGSGTYIRTLCVDIGAALGVPAHMKTLVRESVGAFQRTDALSVSDLVQWGAAAARPTLLSMEAALGFAPVSVSDADALRLDRGQAIPLPSGVDTENGQTVALLRRERLRALARCEQKMLQPFRVFPASDKADA